MAEKAKLPSALAVVWLIIKVLLILIGISVSAYLVLSLFSEAIYRLT